MNIERKILRGLEQAYVEGNIPFKEFEDRVEQTLNGKRPSVGFKERCVVCGCQGGVVHRGVCAPCPGCSRSRSVRRLSKRGVL